MRPGLSRIRRLLAAMDHPDRDFHSVLVTGSNGKGTTCAVLSSCLQSLGWKTGLFTSPHLVSVRERFRVNGTRAPYSAMRLFLRHHGAACRRAGATYFETTTAFALWWFRQSGVEWAVLEIGLGGRHDACNAVNPSLSIVTSIALEHTDWLGRTQAEIAAEKGCVARSGKITLSGPLSVSAERSLGRTIRARGGLWMRVGRDIQILLRNSTHRGSSFDMRCLGHTVTLTTRLRGRKAALNAALAASAAMHLCRDRQTQELPTGWKRALRQGVLAARWPARLETVSRRPQIILDVAHNAASVASLVADWQEMWPERRPVILAGLLDDKPVRAIGSLLSELGSQVVITRPDSPRARDPEQVALSWRGSFERVWVEPVPKRALGTAMALAGKKGHVLVTGSHFVVGPILSQLGIDPGR